MPVLQQQPVTSCRLVEPKGLSLSSCLAPHLSEDPLEARGKELLSECEFSFLELIAITK